MSVFAKPILELLFPNAVSGSDILQISSINIALLMLTQTINGVLQGLGKVYAPTIGIAIRNYF